MAAAAGFGSLFLSGYCTAATLLGLPDVGYVTQTEMAEVAEVAWRVCGAVPRAAVVVDGDTGYGSSLNTIGTVERYEQAGASSSRTRWRPRNAATWWVRGSCRGRTGWPSFGPPSTTGTASS